MDSTEVLESHPQSDNCTVFYGVWLHTPGYIYRPLPDVSLFVFGRKRQTAAIDTLKQTHQYLMVKIKMWALL